MGPWFTITPRRTHRPVFINSSMETTLCKVLTNKTGMDAGRVAMNLPLL